MGALCLTCSSSVGIRPTAAGGGAVNVTAAVAARKPMAVRRCTVGSSEAVLLHWGRCVPLIVPLLARREGWTGVRERTAASGAAAEQPLCAICVQSSIRTNAIAVPM